MVICCARSRKRQRIKTLDPSLNYHQIDNKSLDRYFKPTTAPIEMPKLPEIKPLEPVQLPNVILYETPKTNGLTPSFLPTTPAARDFTPKTALKSASGSNLKSQIPPSLIKKTSAPTTYLDMPLPPTAKKHSRSASHIDMPVLPTMEKIAQDLKEKKSKPQWSITDPNEIDLDKLIKGNK